MYVSSCTKMFNCMKSSQICVSTIFSTNFCNSWGHIIDAVNTDIVVPAEHTINGRHYVGEYRIYHMHDGGKGVAAITSLMETRHSTKDLTYGLYVCR